MVSDNQMGPMLTVKEVARLLHIHSNTVRRWSDRGIIRAFRITRRGDRRFRREDIARFLSELNATKGDEREASSNQRQAKSQTNIDPPLEHLLNSIQDADSPPVFSYRNPS